MRSAVQRRLVTLPISPACEKARWALDRAQIEYEERRLSLGLHKLASRRAGGAGTVPVLVTHDEVLVSSDEIVAYADRHLDARDRLRSSDEAVALARRLDDGLGEDARRWLWGLLIHDPATARRFWSAGLSSGQRRILPVVLRAARRAVIRELGLTADEHAARADRIARTFDAVAERLADGRPYLVGDRFSAADLSFATMASPVIAPEGYRVPVPGPEDLPEEAGRMVTALRDHPAGRFALRLFASRDDDPPEEGPVRSRPSGEMLGARSSAGVP